LKKVDEREWIDLIFVAPTISVVVLRFAVMSHVVTGLWSVFAISLIVMTLMDGFSFINLSRKTEHGTRIARIIERRYWQLVRFVHARTSSVRFRELLIFFYAPVLLVSLLVFSLVSLITGFAILSWAMGEELRGVHDKPDFLDYLYLSGVTFFTLGYGDISPAGPFGKIYSLVEVCCGYSFLGLMIGFTPTFNSVYFDRELGLMRIQTRTGFSPSAAAVLYRSIPERDIHYVHEFFRECTEWMLRMFLSHLCYPILCYHRSPSRRGTWLSGMAVLMDLSAVTTAWMNIPDQRAGRSLHFAGVEELKLFCRLFNLSPDLDKPQTRITREESMQLWEDFQRMGFPLRNLDDPHEQLCYHLNEYSSYLDTLAEYLLIQVPPISMGEVERGGGLSYSTLF
jgi:hypothetical protein